MRGTDVSSMKRTYRTATQGDFPDDLTLSFQKESDLRYGENPNQPAALYRMKGTSLAELTNIRLAKSGKGGLSATNVMDVTRALDILKYFQEPSVAVMKHLIPSGFSTRYHNDDTSLDQLYKNARDADVRSAFGSVVVFNRPLDMVTAGEIVTTYVEGVAAPEYEERTMEILERKKDLRAILFSNLDKMPKFIGDDIEGLYDLKVLPTGRVVAQKPYLSSIKSAKDLVLDPMVKDEKTGESNVVISDPTTKELDDMLTAWYVNLGVRSNGIVFVKDGTTLAIGSGQQERVGAVEQAIIKAFQKDLDRRGIVYDPLEGIKKAREMSINPLQEAVVSSDGFFPFRDSIDLLSRVGVSAVIQPGGSVRDAEVIQAVNKHRMAMAFTLERCFAHF